MKTLFKILFTLCLITMGFGRELLAQDQVMTNEIIELEKSLAELESMSVTAVGDRDYTDEIERARLRLLQAYRRRGLELKSALEAKQEIYNQKLRDAMNIFPRNRQEMIALNRKIAELNVSITRIEGITRRLLSQGPEALAHQKFLKFLRDQNYDGRIYTPISFLDEMRRGRRMVAFLEIPPGAREDFLRYAISDFIQQLPGDAILVVDHEYAPQVSDTWRSLDRPPQGLDIVERAPRGIPLKHKPRGWLLLTEDHLLGFGADASDLKLGGPSFHRLPYVLGAHNKAMIHYIAPTANQMRALSFHQTQFPEGQRVPVTVDTRRVWAHHSMRHIFLSNTEVLQQYPDVVKVDLGDGGAFKNKPRLKTLLVGVARRAAQSLGFIGLGLFLSDVYQEFPSAERRVPPLDDPVLGRDY